MISLANSDGWKILKIIVLANDRKLGNPKLSNVLFPVFITLVPFLLVLIQPDLGTNYSFDYNKHFSLFFWDSF